ncbi:MAG: hypothetical protein RR689_02445 [Mucinivorans sp.]
MNRVFKITRVSQVEQTFLYSAEIDALHPVFCGHFPQKPIVPGVCTMSMIKECLADALSHSVRYDYIKECKFLSAISPSSHKTVEVSLTLKSIEDQMNVVATVHAAGVTMMKLKATLL